MNDYEIQDLEWRFIRAVWSWQRKLVEEENANATSDRPITGGALSTPLGEDGAQGPVRESNSPNVH